MTPETLLLRQVHPAFVQADFISSQVFFITSQVFKPTPKDEGKLSAYNGEKFTPLTSFEHFLQNPVCTSAGVVAVTVQECAKEALIAFENNNPFDGHTVISYSGLANNQIDKKAKKLRNIAMERGWLYKV